LLEVFKFLLVFVVEMLAFDSCLIGLGRGANKARHNVPPAQHLPSTVTARFLVEKLTQPAI
jgi:hypothetical protein